MRTVKYTMNKNVGGYDRLARFIVGPVLVVVGLAAFAGLISLGAGTLGPALAAIALLVGLVLTVTAITQKCPLNHLLGVNTYRGPTTAESSPEVEDAPTSRSD